FINGKLPDFHQVEIPDIWIGFFVSNCLLSALDSHCAQGWLLYGDHCYHFETEAVKNWQNAEAHCTSEQGHLVSFHSQEELSFITGEELRNGTKREWRRLHAVEEGRAGLLRYSWSDGTPLSHTNWGYGEPNNHEGREECVEMVSSTNGTQSWWNDLNCDAHQDWICMIAKGKDPISPPEPPPPIPGNPSLLYRGNKPRVCFDRAIMNVNLEVRASFTNLGVE
uniref:C-type lectin domain-containing protein n=1 Tax=Amphiprion ocellaris TaxID=80972 RepID=A0A3Q1BNZ1_AMPOC